MADSAPSPAASSGRPATATRAPQHTGHTTRQSYYAGRASFRSARPAEDVDPMASLGNIGDIMLVFACGLMTALVIAWNVDLGQFSQVDVGESEAIEQPQAAQEVMRGGGSTYIEKGTVYQDAKTGKYYLIEDDDTASGK